MSQQDTKSEAYLAAQNNDKIADFIFNTMTGIVCFGSLYLYYNLQDYLNNLYSTYPLHSFPEFKDILTAFLMVPIHVVIKLIKFSFFES